MESQSFLTTHAKMAQKVWPIILSTSAGRGVGLWEHIGCGSGNRSTTDCCIQLLSPPVEKVFKEINLTPLGSRPINQNYELTSKYYIWRYRKSSSAVGVLTYFCRKPVIVGCAFCPDVCMESPCKSIRIFCCAVVCYVRCCPFCLFMITLCEKKSRSVLFMITEVQKDVYSWLRLT